MNPESPQRKSPSPRSCTEVVSLQNNRLRNQEGLINFSWLVRISLALERGLQCRRSVKDLVNQGILLNPTICNPVKVKQLQRQKTADMLKRKIEKRPDKQVLINHRILKPGEAGTSAFIQERCHALTKNQLCESLNSKLERRPGSLELVEKGVLQVDPGVANLIRGGSIPYPRVASTSPTQLYTVPENEPIVQPPSPPPPPDFSKNSSRNSLVGGGKSRTPSRSLKDETVISRYGSLVFHNYRPLSAANSNSPSLRVDNSTPTERLPKHRAREVQQAELLNLEDAAQVHRKVGQEICQLKGCPPHKIAQNINEQQQQQTRITQQQIFSPILAAAQSQTPHPHQQCFLISTPATQQTPASVTMVTSPQPSTQSTQPPPVQMNFSQIFSNQSIFEIKEVESPLFSKRVYCPIDLRGRWGIQMGNGIWAQWHPANALAEECLVHTACVDNARTLTPIGWLNCPLVSPALQYIWGWLTVSAWTTHVSFNVKSHSLCLHVYTSNNLRPTKIFTQSCYSLRNLFSS
ncbi:hypothetical protein ACTXT7_008223 [Hymenolepis weldensis]